MLCYADRDVIRRDTELPALGTLLDPEAFKAHLQHAHDGAIEAVTLRYLRYKPATNCLAAYDVVVGGRSFLVYGKAWREKDRQKFTDAWARPASSVQAPLHRTINDRVALLTEVFPDDARLRTLRSFASQEYRRKYFQQHNRLRHIPEDATLSALNYKPERRFVGCLSSKGRPLAAVKVYSDSSFKQVQRAAKGIHSGRFFAVPKCLRASERRRVLIFEWCEGRLLREWLCKDSSENVPIAEVARALADFHDQETANLPPLSIEFRCKQLLGQAEMIGTLQPHLSGFALELAERIAVALANAPESRVPLHGDFYAKQVLLNNKAVTFLDCDEAAIGNPLFDVGNFLAHIEADAIRGRLSNNSAAQIAGEFCEHYSFATNRLATDARLFTASQLFALVPHFFRCREPDWPEKAERALIRVNQLLTGTSCKARTSGNTEKFNVPVRGIDLDEAGIPQMAIATNGAFIGDRIRAASADTKRELKGCSLMEIKVVRCKPGRRSVIEYGFRNEASPSSSTIRVFGKVTAKKPKDFARLVAVSLRAKGLDGSERWGIPEPLGTVPEAQMQLQRKVSGTSATDGLVSAEGNEVARRCAGLIHRLHASGVSTGRMHTIRDELDILSERFSRLKLSHPGIAPRLTRLLARCDELAGNIPRAEPTLIHRDYYPDQVLQDGQCTWLLDLDLSAMGDPCLDHGNFIAHIVELSLRKFGSVEALSQQQQAYRDEALKLRGEAAAASIDYFSTLSLARHIFISTQFPDRTPFTETILGYCEVCFGLTPT